MAALDAGGAMRSGENTVTCQRAGVAKVAWVDGGWQAALCQPRVEFTVTSRDLRITAPAAWRAHVHFGWRDSCLLVSPDLRTVAAAVGAAQHAPAGVAAFLAGGRAGPGLAPSIYRGVQTLQPGHSVTINPDGCAQAVRTWTPERDHAFTKLPLDAAATRLRMHLDHLAERILSRHQRVACLFSGGLDSTLVAAMLLRRAPDRVVLFNVGSALGTAAEARLRERFLREYGTISHPVNLPAQAGLVRSLRATNAVAALPGGSLFAHVFEEITGAARNHGCDAIATGDGGDEIFAEREEVLVDLLVHHRRALPAAVGHFALRNGERGARTLRRALHTLRFLSGRAGPLYRPAPGDVLLEDDLAGHVAAARHAREVETCALWAAGWTYSGLGSYRRAAAVPEWEPVSAAAPAFPVISPLADEMILKDALALRRDALVTGTCGSQPKWLLRQAALAWLPPEVALHPKTGRADQQILARLRSDDHRHLLELLGSGTATRAGLRLPAAAEDPGHPLWHGDGWIKAAALVAWLDQPVPVPARPAPMRTVATPAARPVGFQVAVRPARTRAASWRVAVLAALNIAAQAAAKPPFQPAALSIVPAADHRDDELCDVIADLARRACAMPWVSGSSRVMSQALAWYLRLAGVPAVVVRGVQEGQRDIRYWVQAGGTLIDVHGAETPLLAIPGRLGLIGEWSGASAQAGAAYHRSRAWSSARKAVSRR